MPRKLRLLKKLVTSVGGLWPEPSTRLAGFASDGPYSCSNCEYLSKTRDRCRHEAMLMDTEVQHDDKGMAIISDPEHQCCEFVEPPKAAS